MAATTVDNLVMVAAIVNVMMIVVQLMVATASAFTATPTTFATLWTLLVTVVIIKLHNIRVVRY